MKNTFKIETTETENEITIVVSCKKNKFAAQKKLVFDPKLLKNTIAEKVNNRNIELISEPAKQVSNIDRDKYTNIGIWKYKIIKNEKKDLTKVQKKVNIKKENNKTSTRRRRPRTIANTQSEENQ